MQQIYELSRDETPRVNAWYKDNNYFHAHFHSTIELVYVEKGVLAAMQDGVTTLVPAGRLIVNSSYMVHSYDTPESSRIIVCTIPLSAALPLRAQLARSRFAQSIVEIGEMEECRRILMMMADPANEHNTLFLNAMGEALLALLIDRIGLMLKEVGVKPKLCGYRYMLCGILMMIKEREGAKRAGRLYAEIAKRFQTTPYNIERSIRYGVESAFETGDLAAIEKLFGYTVDPRKGKPTNLEFISTLADRVLLP